MEPRPSALNLCVALLTTWVQGYKRGRTEALASVETEIARQAAVEYAQLALNEETQRVADVAEHVKALRAKQFRCVESVAHAHLRCRQRSTLCARRVFAAHRLCRAPARETQCRVEEDAVVQCDFSRTPEACAQVVRAYERCADAAIFALMNPSRAAGSSKLQ
ncbi:hypothetical protein EON67_06995 [archaeon]|nr:MAG: hypothetical protein EON67_06995 [archaeon]